MDVCMHIHTVRKGLEHYRAWGAAQLLFCCCDRNTLTEQLREQRFVGLNFRVQFTVAGGSQQQG